jgi:hypothetical protein
MNRHYADGAVLPGLRFGDLLAEKIVPAEFFQGFIT